MHNRTRLSILAVATLLAACSQDEADVAAPVDGADLILTDARV